MNPILFLTATLNGASCIPRKHVCVPWYNYLQEFNQTMVHKQAKASRPVVVRSELAGTGIPDSAYPLSGFSRIPFVSCSVLYLTLC
jgi:1-acyl-sn-glycerol-3-phosphate acyltransferase